MLLSCLPFADILASIGLCQGAMSIKLIIRKVARVAASANVLFYTFTMLLVLAPVSGISSIVRPMVCPIVTDAITEYAFVVAAISVRPLAESLLI